MVWLWDPPGCLGDPPSGRPSSTGRLVFPDHPLALKRSPAPRAACSFQGPNGSSTFSVQAQYQAGPGSPASAPLSPRRGPSTWARLVLAYGTFLPGSLCSGCPARLPSERHVRPQGVPATLSHLLCEGPQGFPSVLPWLVMDGGVFALHRASYLHVSHGGLPSLVAGK